MAKPPLWIVWPIATTTTSQGDELFVRLCRTGRRVSSLGSVNNLDLHDDASDGIILVGGDVYRSMELQELTAFSGGTDDLFVLRDHVRDTAVVDGRDFCRHSAARKSVRCLL